LVVVYEHGQLPFELNEAYSIAMENANFFGLNAHFEHLINLIKEYRSCNEYDPKKKAKIKKAMERLKPSYLLVKEFWAEIRFPALKFAYIQEIKQSKYCVQESMDMSTVSIRVILRLQES
jgi:hypothetical protein